jgi:glycerol kinase
MRVLAIDQGTSATKAIVMDDGCVVAAATAACATSATPDGGVEVAAEAIWQSVLVAGRDALAKCDERGLDAIGLANQGETVVAWDRSTGAPFGPAISWQDRRSVEVCDRIRAAGGADALEAITGLELDPYFVAPKLRWLRDRIGAGPVITTSDVWLVHRLCGAFVTDAATASRTLLMDLVEVAWSDAACQAFEIDAETLPEIVPNAGHFGTTDAFGPAGVPLTGLCVDQQAALFGQSCTEAGDAKCTYGTGAFLLASTGGTPTWSRNGLVGSVGWQLGGSTTWCLDGQAYTVGAAVTWLQEMGCIDGPADLDGLGATVASSGGVTFIPGLAGLAAPFWAPLAKGSLTGLSLGTSRAHLVRAVVDGIAAQVAWLARAAAADLGAPLSRLRVDGGLTRSRLLLQTQADLLQIPIEVAPSPDATALGVAAFACIGAGEPGAAPEWRPAAVVEPRISADEADDRLCRWRAVAEATVALDG